MMDCLLIIISIDTSTLLHEETDRFLALLDSLLLDGDVYLSVLAWLVKHVPS